MENNLCECGHEKKEHTKHGCLFKHTFFHEHCPCKKFKPQNQTRQDKSPRHSLRYAENNQSHHGCGLGDNCVSLGCFSPKHKIKVHNQSQVAQEKSGIEHMSAPNALRGLKIGGKVMPKEFFNPKFIQEKGIFDTADLEKEINKHQKIYEFVWLQMDSLEYFVPSYSDIRKSLKGEDNLKEEAIKWLKHFNVTSEDFYIIGGWSIDKWIKHFFNITEEELE